MKNNRIRILDKKNNIISVQLLDILNIIENGKDNYWSILFLWATGNLKKYKSMLLLEQKISQSDIGLELCWENLLSLSSQFYQIIVFLLLVKLFLKLV